MGILGALADKDQLGINIPNAIPPSLRAPVAACPVTSASRRSVAAGDLLIPHVYRPVLALIGRNYRVVLEISGMFWVKCALES